MKELPHKINPAVPPSKQSQTAPQDHPHPSQQPASLQPRKPGLLQIREIHNLSTFRISEASGISTDIVYYMLVRVPVRRKDAQRVISAVNRLTGKTYTLEEMDVALVDEEGG